MSEQLTAQRDAFLGRSSLIETLQRQFKVIYALMMHDIKSRFFGSGLGYIMTIIWPSAHVGVVVAIYYFAGHPVPYGDDRLLYACIGVLPYVIWNYVSRFTHLGLVMNKNFLQYPIVKPLDIMIARQALEIVSSVIIIIEVLAFLFLCGSNPMPAHPDEAIYAILSTLLLGIGFGILGGVLVMIFPLFNIIYVGILLIFWFSSGLILNPETMPYDVAKLFAWNPLLHSIEWLRLAYYDDFPARLLDRGYVLGMGAGTLCLGLILERALRFLTTR